MEVAYILSPARSGSTFLQTLIGAHPQVVGIGEVSHVLREYCQTPVPRNPAHGGHCSCGAQPELCPFWGSILGDLPRLAPGMGFRHILEHFAHTFPGKTMVDSSKSGGFLENFYLSHAKSEGEPEVQLKILYLVRDFRGWVTSIRKHRSRAGTGTFWNSSIVLNSYRWFYTSTKWLLRIRRYAVPFLPVYYEHLVFDGRAERFASSRLTFLSSLLP